MPRLDIWGAGAAGGEPPGGGGMGIRITRAEIYVQQATINVARANVNLGGGPGGGRWNTGATGFGPGANRGGMAGMRAPFGGGGAMAMAGNYGIAALGLSAAASLIVAVIKDIVNAPALLGRLWGSALSAAQPYIDVKLAAYALGRGGGFGGQGLLRGVFPGGYQTPEWMQALGATPQSALRSVSSLGVLPRSANEAIRAAQVNAMYGLSPGFAGMAPGTVERIGAQGLAMGQTSMGNLQGYIQIFASVMDEAVARGMDRARILSSMQDSLEIIAKSAPAMGVGGMAEFFSRMAGLGTPGARTGALQGQIVTGLAGTMQNPFGSPNTAMMSVQLAGRFNNFRSEADIRRFLHLPAGVTPAGMPQAVWQDWVHRITSAAQVSPSLGAALAMQLGQGMPGAQQEVLRSAGALSSGLPAGLQPYAMSSFTGLPLTAAMGAMQAPLVPGPGVGGASAAAVAGMSVGAGLTPMPMAFDPNVDYASILRSAGVPDKIAQVLIDAGRRNNVNPLVMAAIAQRESNFQPGRIGSNTKMVPDPNTGGMMPVVTSKDYGLMQINQANLSAFGLTPKTALDPSLNANAGAQFLATRGLGAYNPGDPGYVADITRRYAAIAGGGNIPSDVLGAQARAAQAQVTGGASAMATFIPAVGAVNDALSSLVRAAQSVMSALSNMVAAGQGGAQTPLASPGSAQ